jgi:hypothetical protein
VSARKFSVSSLARSGAGLASLVAAVLVATGCTDRNADREARLASLRDQRLQLVRQFASVQNAIRRTQAAALDDPGVRHAQQAFYDALQEEMTRIDPRAEGWLAEARRIGADLDRLSTPLLLGPGEEPPAGSAEERAAVARRLKEMEGRFRPLVDSALAAPEVAARFAVLQDSLRVAMLRRDSTAAATFARMETIGRRIAGLDSTIHRLER